MFSSLLLESQGPMENSMAASGGCTASAPKSSSGGPHEKPADDRMMVGWWLKHVESLNQKPSRNSKPK